MRRLWLAAPLTLLATAAAPAYAYFCTLAVCNPEDRACTNPRPTQAWQQRCIPFYVSTSGSLFDGTAGEQLVIQSFAQWSGNDCTDLQFKFMGRTTEREAWNPNNPADNKNVIASVEDSQADFEDEPRLLALTLTRYAVATGEIFDADIIVNAVDHEFDEVADGVACRNTTRAFDLRNTLVHEMGHFIGFDHTPVQDATMFASADTCEVAKRDLASDELVALKLYRRDRLNAVSAHQVGPQGRRRGRPAAHRWRPPGRRRRRPLPDRSSGSAGRTHRLPRDHRRGACLPSGSPRRSCWRPRRPAAPCPSASGRRRRPSGTRPGDR
jgi:hypothetical protein